MTDPAATGIRPPVLVPTASATLKLVSEPTPAAADAAKATELYLEFDSMQMEPKHAQIFLATGGAIAAAAPTAHRLP